MPWSCAAGTKWLLMMPFVVHPHTKNVPASSRNGRVQNASRSTVTACATAARALGGAAPADGLRVVGINPGPILTDRLETLLRRRAQDTLGDAERWRETMAAMPFGRAGRVEEVAALVAFLASDLSGYTSGTIVTVDGGMASRRKAF